MGVACGGVETFLCDLDVLELVVIVRRLECENARLRRELSRRMCGDLMGSSSCQLPRGHDGLHAWSAHDSELVIRWG